MYKPETLEKRFNEVSKLIEEINEVKLDTTTISLTKAGVPLFTSLIGKKRTTKLPSFVFALLTRYFIEFRNVTNKDGWIMMANSFMDMWIDESHPMAITRLKNRAKELGIITDTKLDNESKHYAKVTYYKINKKLALDYLEEMLSKKVRSIITKPSNLGLMNGLAVDYFVKDTYNRIKTFYEMNAKHRINSNDSLTDLEKSNLHNYYTSLLKHYHSCDRKRKANEKRVQRMKQEFPDFMELKREIDPNNHFKFLEDGNLRLTSPYVSTLNPNNPESTRYKEMAKYLEVSPFHIEEIDLNGEAFRNAYLIGNGKVFPFDKDIYHSLWEHMDIQEKDLYDKSKLGLFDNDVRAIIKTFIMSVFTRPYQLNYTKKRYRTLKKEAKQFRTQIEAFYQEQGVELEDNQLYLVQLNNNYKELPFSRFSTYDMFLLEAGTYISRKMGMKFKTFITKFEKACQTFFNWKKENYKERVLFNLHSSNIQILMMHMLNERGIKVTTVYDCFYFERGKINRQELNDIYEMAQLQYNLILEENHKEYLNSIRND